MRRLWLCLVFLLCVINLYHPYETGFALFCALAYLLGSLAGVACGWLRWNSPISNTPCPSSWDGPCLMCVTA